jgi:membrane protease YdiL (CAAX protease family)
MQKILTTCKTFYYSSPNFAARLFKIVLLSFPALLLWDLLTEIMLEDILKIHIPDVFDQFKSRNIPNSVIHFFIVVLGPIIETLLFQKWTFQILKWLGNKLSIENRYGIDFNLKLATLISALLFAASHYQNHPLYPILVLPAGLILGWIYLDNLKEFNSKSRAFWMTACFHMCYNGIATIFYLIDHAGI